MKLYQAGMSPSCRRVSIFLHEIGADVERIEMNVRAGDNLAADFVAKSVNGKVPLLELDDGGCVEESIAICRYFDLQHSNDKGLFGYTAAEQAQVEMWQRIVEFDGLYAGFQAFRNLSGVYSDRERCVAAWGEESKQRVIEFLPKLDKRLAGRDYVACDHFTIADITAFIFIGFCLKALELPVLEQHSHINTWFAAISQRPSVQSVP